MTAHELARALLEMPDVPVEVYNHKLGEWYKINKITTEAWQDTDDTVDIEVE